MNDSNDMAILNGEAEVPNDGSVAPLDGSQTSLTTSGSHTSLVTGASSASLGAGGGKMPLGIDGKKPAANVQEALAKLALGPNNERLEDLRPDLVNALRELEVQYRQEGIVARRHDVNTNQLFKWRRAFECGELVDSTAAYTVLLPVTVSAPSEAALP